MANVAVDNQGAKSNASKQFIGTDTVSGRVVSMALDQAGTVTTVGAAGGATALPATPLGYFQMTQNGVLVSIPFFNP